MAFIFFNFSGGSLSLFCSLEDGPVLLSSVLWSCTWELCFPMAKATHSQGLFDPHQGCPYPQPLWCLCLGLPATCPAARQPGVWVLQLGMWGDLSLGWPLLVVCSTMEAQLWQWGQCWVRKMEKQLDNKTSPEMKQDTMGLGSPRNTTVFGILQCPPYKSKRVQEKVNVIFERSVPWPGIDF